MKKIAKKNNVILNAINRYIDDVWDAGVGHFISTLHAVYPDYKFSNKMELSKYLRESMFEKDDFSKIWLLQNEYHKINDKKSNVKKFIVERLHKKYPKQNKNNISKKVSFVLGYLNLLEEYKKINLINRVGIRMFTQIDKDGKERDYFGFPADMIFNVRKTYLLGNWRKSKHAKYVMGIHKEIDQTTKIKNKDITRLRNEMFAFIYKQNIKNFKTVNILDFIKALIFSKPGLFPLGRATKPPTLKYLQRIASTTPISKATKDFYKSQI